MSKTAQSSKPRLLIWGASGHARVVADIVRLRGDYEIVGFLDDVNAERHHTEICGATILGGREQLDRQRQMGVGYIILAFGDCQNRLKLAEMAKAKGYQIATAIHPRATLASDVRIDAGTVIAAGAVVNPGVSVGSNVIINTGAIVDHECLIEEGAHICPGARLAGRVTVARAAWIGIGATIIDHVRIGAGALIGAGSVVVNDIPDGVVAYGVPARVIRRAVKNVQE